jgi:hypothetical protein
MAAAVVGAFGWQSRQRQSVLDEGARMQSIYVALSMYESSWNGELPPDLMGSAPYLGSPTRYVSPKDPFANATGPFPNDAGLPEKRASENRVSDTYLFAHAAAGRINVAPWRESRYDTTLGLIANEWYGSVTPKEGFQANVSGLVLRITTGGSLVRVRRDGPKALGDVDDLFRRKAERK